MPRANGATAELFHEPINWKKVAGIGLPVIGGSLILTGAALKFINGNETATAAKISNPEPRVDTKPIPEHTPPSLAKDSVVKNYMERYGLSGEVSDWKGMIDYVNGSIIKSGSSNGKYIGHKITDIADTHTIGFDNTPLRTIYVDITREDVDGKYTRTFRFNFTDKNGKWSYIGAQSN